MLQETSTIIYLKASSETIFDRIKNSKHRPLLKQGFGIENVTEILMKREMNYNLADYTIVTDGKTPAEVVDEILEIVNV